MKNSIKRKVFLGFIYIHILYHAKEAPIYGSWMINELQEHGYHMSPGTLYPIFHAMEEEGLLKVRIEQLMVSIENIIPLQLMVDHFYLKPKTN